MSDFVCVSRARFAFRLALTGAAAGMLAGCSNSERLSDPWSNPFQTSANVASEAPAARVAAAMPVSPVQSRPLGAPTASANPWPEPSPRLAAAAPPRRMQGAAGWSAQGGSPIVVAQGENAKILSNRYGVPLNALVRANGFTSASQIRPGTRIIVPVYSAALAASSGAKVAANHETSKASTHAKIHGAPPTTLAREAARLRSGKAAEPATKTAASKAAAKRARKEAQRSAKPAVSQKVAAVKTEPKSAATMKREPIRTAKAATDGETKGAANDAASPAAAAGQPKPGAMANPEFRWPAHGRIIASFKPGGNDGINIAVPDGTSVKAAESGVVAYAGNELKAYGNLILIRHPNGFVSAYANNGDLEVKRGETVKRGQTIAKSGQSGNVTSPQLHFELRKGTKPVDPTLYLAGA